MSIAEYLEWYILYIPKAIYGWGLAVFLVILVTSMLWKGIKTGVRYGAAALLVEYVVLLLYFTVFMWRETDKYNYLLTPFWSYRAAISSTPVLAQEIAMNIAVFLPVGVFAGIAIKCVTWRKVACIGFGVSLTIEMLQLVLKRGCCETDDVINNTLGSLIGYGLYIMLRKAV